MTRCLIRCSDPVCRLDHAMEVPIVDGCLPVAVQIQGLWYRLAEEDRGPDDGLSVPVYRTAVSVVDEIRQQARSTREH